MAFLIAGGTAAHGFVTGRWAAHAAKVDLELPEIPLVIGDWKGEDLKSGLADDKHLRNLTRKYGHTKSGRSITVSLTLGPAGLGVIAFDRQSISIVPNKMWVDTMAIKSSVMSDEQRTTADLLNLCRGRLLEEFDGLGTSCSGSMPHSYLGGYRIHRPLILGSVITPMMLDSVMDGVVFVAGGD